jgi:diaminopimelate epimerase
MQFSFIKGHGSRNDFMIIDEEQENLILNDHERSTLAIKLCDRESGIGADGILFVSASQIADAKMRVFNSDGSEASMCGNGLRLVARYTSDKLNKKYLQIETMRATLSVEKEESLYKGIQTYKVEISPISFQSSTLPININQEKLMNASIKEISETLTFTALSVPNPHLVSIVSKEVLQSDSQKKIAEKLNRPNLITPDGVNVSFVLPLEPNEIFVRTFERGVGFTNACGTAMSASALVSCLLELTAFGEVIQVFNPGGMVECICTPMDVECPKIDLIGNATYEYHANIHVELNSSFQWNWVSKNDLEENRDYEEFEREIKNKTKGISFM